MLPRVRFGKTGLEVTRIGLGGYAFGGVNKARGWDPFTPEGRAAAIITIHAALDAGINYIDTAPSYGSGNSETILGEATHGLRDRFVLASKADLGVAVMRPLTSGILERLAGYIAPHWQQAHDLYEVALKFVLSDSRVHVANLGMRWPHEVHRNVALAQSFRPPFDLANLPRGTADIYRTDDEMHPA